VNRLRPALDGFEEHRVDYAVRKGQALDCGANTSARFIEPSHLSGGRVQERVDIHAVAEYHAAIGARVVLPNALKVRRPPLSAIGLPEEIALTVPIVHPPIAAFSARLLMLTKRALPIGGSYDP